MAAGFYAQFNDVASPRVESARQQQLSSERKMSIGRAEIWGRGEMVTGENWRRNDCVIEL